MTYQEEQYAKQTLIQLIKGLNWFDIPNHLKEIFKRITTQITNLTTRVEILENGNTTEYIPLSGTEVGKPVTGDIEFSEYKGLVRTNENEQKTSFIGFEDGNVVLKTYDDIDSFLSQISTVGNSVEVYTTNPNSVGLVGVTDFSDRTTGDLSQDKRVYTQRSYVEKPQTLINALSNCDSTQLDEIKTILGIISKK